MTLKSHTDAGHPYLFYIAGVVISFLLSGLTWLLLTDRRRALAEAQKLNAELLAEKNHLANSEAEKQRALDLLSSQKLALDHHAIVCTTDLNGRITYANWLFCELSGYSQEELIGSNHKTISSGLHPASFFSEMYQTLFAGKVWQGEMCNKKKNGDFFWVKTSIAPNCDANGKPFEFVVVRTDVTQAKKDEQALRDQQYRLSLATKAGGIGVWDYDIVNNRLVWDDMMFRLYGADKQNFSGAYEAWRENMHPEDIARSDQESQDAIKGIKPYNTEFRVVHDDGSIHTIRAIAEVVFDTAGNALRMIGVNWDITQSKQQALTLIENEQRLNLVQKVTRQGLWDWNLKTGQVIHGDEWYALLGAKRGEIGTTMEDFRLSCIPMIKPLFLSA